MKLWGKGGQMVKGLFQHALGLHPFMQGSQEWIFFKQGSGRVEQFCFSDSVPGIAWSLVWAGHEMNIDAFIASEGQC